MTGVKAPELVAGEGGFGNPDDPGLAGVPTGVASLTGTGVSAAWDAVSGSAAAQAEIATQLRTNAKGLVVHMFHLSAQQQLALWQMPEDDLSARLAPLADALDDNNVAGVTVAFGPPSVTLQPEREFHAIAISPLPIHPPIVQAACKWTLEIHFKIESA